MPDVLDGSGETLAVDEPSAGVSPSPDGRLVAARRWVHTHIVALAGVSAGAIALFLLYLRQARYTPLNADGSSNALQAWDILHGNLLLSHWNLSDVSFYLTELPEYMLVEAVHGLNGDVVHVAAALTYTLAVLLACWLAKGRARGAEAAVRILIVLVVILAPGRGAGSLLLGSPDHFGTAVPLLLFFLAVERLPRRWFTPVILFALLTWAEVSDSTAIFIGGGALAVIAGLRLWQGRGARRHEAALLAAAVLSIAASVEFPKLVQRLGGFYVHPAAMDFSGAAAMSQAFWATVSSYLSVLGADFFGLPLTTVTAGGGQRVQVQTVIVLLHLFGTALVTWALVAAAQRLRGGGSDADGDRGTDLIAKLVTVGVLLNLAGLLFSSQISGGDREIAAALPLGAVVAARVLGPRIMHGKHMALLGGFAVMFGVVLVHNASAPGAPADSQAAEVWLKQHGYTYGLGGYWSSHNITVESGDSVRVRPVVTHIKGIEEYTWESDSTWYDPASNYANFLVMDLTNPSGIGYATPQQAVKQFGKPKAAVVAGGQEIMVWNKNLLAALPPPEAPGAGGTVVSAENSKR